MSGAIGCIEVIVGSSGIAFNFCPSTTAVVCGVTEYINQCKSDQKYNIHEESDINVHLLKDVSSMRYLSCYRASRQWRLQQISECSRMQVGEVRYMGRGVDSASEVKRKENGVAVRLIEVCACSLLINSSFAVSKSH